MIENSITRAFTGQFNRYNQIKQQHMYRSMKKFIGEEIEVLFDKTPLFSKRPDCPDGFIWREKEFKVAKNLKAWQDFSRRGSQQRNMSPEHAERVSMKGSWGVGRYFFQIETYEGEVFEIYYDRSPEKSDDRSGHWFLLSIDVKYIE